MRVLAPLKYASDMARSRIHRTPHLSLAFIYPTYRCNLQCIYCDNPSRKTPELSIHEWRSVIEQLAELGCWRVTILGGEPLLRSDISDIIQHIRDQGMSCVLTSNGLLVPGMIKQIQEVNTLTLSLDAVGPANDEVRGKGVFNAVQDAIHAAKGAAIPVKINSVLSVKTAPFVDELLAFVDQNDLRATFNILRKGASDRREPVISTRNSDEGIKNTLEKFALLAKKNHRILFSHKTYYISSFWPDFSRDRYTAEELPPESDIQRKWPRCQAGRFFITIDPQGEIFPCVINAEKIKGGNVVTDGVKSCWTKLQKHQCVACYAPCLVELNRLFSLSLPVIFSFMSRFLYRFS